MSLLLDDVSIVVTPNGYKAGTLYGVIPVPTEGAEEVVNGDFATDSDWTIGGTTFSAGAILLDNANEYVFQGWTDTVNTLYKLTITKTGLGTLRFRSGFAGSAATKIEIPESGIIYFTSTSDTNRIQIYGDENSINATLNSVSVKEYTSSDMDVTRATAATRVDENGLVNYAEILGSEEVPSITGIVNAGGGTITQISGNSYSSTSDGTSSSSIRPKIDLATTAGKRYKLIITPTGTTSGTVKFKFYDGSNYLFENYDFTTTKEIYFVDNGSVFGTFDGTQTYDVSSFTVSVKEVTRDNVPRIDYTGGGCPHILAEPQRTNLVTYSEAISLSTGDVNSGTGSGNTVTDNYGISPDGTQNATRLVASSATGASEYSLRNFVLTTSIAESYTQSVYLKSNTGSNQKLSYYGRGTGTRSFITVTNEWQRFEITGTSNTTNYYIYLGLRPEDGTDSSCDVLVYGLQLEQGSYPTSYIPTSGSTVTRNQDIFTRDGIGSLINSTEGVLFVEMAALSNDSTFRTISINNGTNETKVQIAYYTASQTVEALVKVSNVRTYDYSYVLTDITDINKLAIKYKQDDFAFWVNGTEVDTSVSGNVPTGLNVLSFDNGNSGSPLYAKVKQLQVYNTALTDEQLLQLTGESGTDFYESYAEMAAALTYTIQ